jgi:hypothetical protein
VSDKVGIKFDTDEASAELSKNIDLTASHSLKKKKTKKQKKTK